MARPLRIHVVDGWYHVMSRGNGGETLFRRDDDRRVFLGLVSELPERFGTEVHAFVLMDNRYHLLVRCRRTDLREGAGKLPGVKYGSLAQGVRRFWRRAGERTELEEFVGWMRNKCK